MNSTLESVSGDEPALAGQSPEDPQELESEFLSGNLDYYGDRFRQLESDGNSLALFNWAAAMAGPLWAAARGVWPLFWLALFGQTLCIVLFLRAFWSGDDGEATGFAPGLLLLSLLLLAALSLAQGSSANWLLWKAFARWRHGRGSRGDFDPRRLAAGAVLQLVFFAVAIARFGIPTALEYIKTFPAPRVIQRTVSKGIDDIVDWLIINFETLFNWITIGLREILNFLEAILTGIPWPIMVILVVLLSWRTAGRRIAVFSAVALVYIGLFGYWEKSMSTLSLVGASALLCIVIGTPLGIWCAKNARVYAVVKPVLDFMQTMPSFVYLIPAVAFFSIGKPPGVFATVIFAMPPMIRLTALGIQQVPHDVKEAALAFGASPWKLLVKVELPLAIPSLMTGANQTIMMSLSMVIVASMIGAGGLGYDVLKALRHLNTGEGMLAGTAIVFCAMMLDRIIQGKGGWIDQR